MIQQGPAGLSRGDENSPAMNGVAFSGTVPLYSGACERSPILLDWLEDCCELGNDLEVLEPEEWFTHSHTHPGVWMVSGAGRSGWGHRPVVRSYAQTPNLFPCFCITVVDDESLAETAVQGNIYSLFLK
jgi:hypothetical protein